MHNRNISNHLDQLFRFAKRKTPLSKEDLLTCQNIISTIQDHDSSILNTFDEFELTLLMYAANNQHREVVNALLDAKADPNIQNKDGMTALILCSHLHDNVMIAKDLLNSGANMDLIETAGRPGATALMKACFFYHRKIAKLLIEQKANINVYHKGTALSIALNKKDNELVLRLLNANAIIDFEESSFDLKKMERYLQTFKKYNRYHSIDKSFTLDKFLSNSKLPPPNQSALLEDRLSTIILKKKPQSNQDMIELQQCLREIKECKEMSKSDINEALILAAYHRSTPFVMELLQAGADVNYVDQWGRTALLGSANDKDMCALLLEHRADSDLHLNNSGRLTPLILSIRENNEAVFDALLKAGADINKDLNGCTPLYWAVFYNRRTMIQKLIDTNAGCIFSQEHLNLAKEIDRLGSNDSLYSFLTNLQESHTCPSGKSLLYNQLDEAIGNSHYPIVLSDLIASYDQRYNHNCFFRREEDFENKIEIKPEPIINNEDNISMPLRLHPLEEKLHTLLKSIPFRPPGCNTPAMQYEITKNDPYITRIEACIKEIKECKDTPPPSLDTQLSKGQIPLTYCTGDWYSRSTSKKLIEILIKGGANIQSQDAFGNTLLKNHRNLQPAVAINKSPFLLQGLFSPKNIGVAVATVSTAVALYKIFSK